MLIINLQAKKGSMYILYFTANAYKNLPVFFCNIYGKGSEESAGTPVIFANCSYHFPTNIARKTYSHPVNACKHLQCMYVYLQVYHGQV